MEQSFLGEVNSLSGQIKNSPKKFGFPYSFTSFKLDVLMERRFSKVAKVSFLTGEQECSKVAVYIKKSIPNVNLKETPTEIKERLVHEYNETERIYNSLEKFPDIFVPRPIAIYPANLTYVIGECPGKPLSQLIEKKCKIWSPSFKKKELIPTLFSVGKALQTFHNLESTHEIKPINFNEMENYFHVRIEKILKNNNLFAKGLGERIIHYLRNNQSELDARDLKQTISHCDFSPGNILVSQSGIAILDFARVNQWSPFLDLTHLYHHIYNFSYKPIFDKKTVQNITDSFLAGYGDINLKNHVLFKLFLIQNKLCQLVYLSRKSEHSLKSRLYNHYVMTKSVEMLEKMVPG